MNLRCTAQSIEGNFNFYGKHNDHSISFSQWIKGPVEPGMPEISLPPFQITHNNQTLSFTQICSELGSGIIVVPLVAVLANVAIAKAFSKWYEMKKWLQQLLTRVKRVMIWISIFSNWFGRWRITRDDHVGSMQRYRLVFQINADLWCIHEISCQSCEWCQGTTQINVIQ